MGMNKFVWLVLLILVSVRKWGCEGCWKEERDALLQLYVIFDYPSLGWVDGTDCCQWKRVKCNTTTSRVVALNLNWMWDYKPDGYRWYLNFSYFQVFEDLRNLSLSGNTIGGCAQNLGSDKQDLRLKNLQMLDLSDNYLNDTNIVSCLSGFSSLNSLYLQGNELTGKSSYGFPALLSKLTNLEELDLGWNYLNESDLFSSLSELSSLKVLRLNDNALTSTSLRHHDDETLWPKSLEALYLNENYLSNDIVSSFSEVHHLKLVDLESNHLEGSLDISGLTALSKLETLVLNYNNITNLNVPEGLSWPTNLEDLQLIGNNISNDIISSLNDLQHLKSLDLSDNNLEGSLDISGLDVLNKLEMLDLSENSIVNLDVHQGTKNLSSIKVLYLNGNNMDGSMLRESLQAFSSIRSLDLSNNKFNGKIVGQDFGDLNKLEELSLESSFSIENEFFKSIGALTSLKFLNMEYCLINDTLPNADWSKLNKLEELDLSYNAFEGPLPLSFYNLTSLQNLDLFNNHFTGNIASILMSLTSLEYLDFSKNQFEVPASFTSLANHSYIKFIYGNGNKLIPDLDTTTEPWIPKFQLQEFILSSTIENHSFPLPNFLFYQYNLTSVDLTNWIFDEEFPSWLLENNTKMTNLLLSNCSFTGHLQLPSHPNIQIINVSDNSIAGTIISKNNSSIFPNLKIVDLSNNNFSGSIPSSIFDTSIQTLDISNNNFGGGLPKDIANSSYLIELYMDNNHFEGYIPTEFVKHRSLYHLDLSRNNLSGPIPSLVNTSVKFLYLSNNRLKGFSARLFDENSSLILLDLSYNKITNGLQALVSNFAQLNILLLKGNNFMGPIPEQLCRLTNLTIVDLSYNILSGSIPKCLGEINFKVGDLGLDLDFERSYEAYGDYSMIMGLEANFNTKGRSYTYKWRILSYMTGMDLSHNKLDGNIPFELGNLIEIRAINLSHNYLTGEIPTKFSNLKQIESLDLSFNNLSGSIPSQLIELNFLEVFSVAYNNISGPTPERKAQFMTFDDSSYEGNPFLCGPPLRKSCSNHIRDPFDSVSNALDGEGDNDGFLDMQVFYVSFVVAYTMVLLVMATVLYINPYWQQVWFYFIEFVIASCYYFFVDLFYKMSTIRNM